MAPVADDVLARSAVEGDAAAFAELYDRHERRAFNLAYRICGTREDAADATQEAFLKVLARLPRMAGRELEFGSYLLTAVRHASYDVLAAARRAEPAGELPAAARPVGAAPPPPEEDPDRRVLLAAQQEEIRAANATLPPRQREVLALRELEDLSYDEIAMQMGMNRNSVAQLISRARIGLRDALRRTALGSITPATAACERALALLAMRDDGELDGDAWLDEHLTDCETCILGREAMAEAGASYRAWAPITALEVLRRETLARADERFGHRPSASPAPAPPSASRMRMRRDALVAVTAGVVLLLVVLVPHAQDGVVEAEPQSAAPAPVTAPPAAPPRRDPRASPAVAARRSSKPAASARLAPPAPASAPTRPVAAPPQPAVVKPRASAAARPASRAPRAPVITAAPRPLAPPPAPADEQPAVPGVPPEPPPPPPPPPRSPATNLVSPPPPPSSTDPRRTPPPRAGSSSASGGRVP